MDLMTLVGTIRQCVQDIPAKDGRAEIGPRPFLVTLIFSFCRDTGQRTLTSLRRSMAATTRTLLARSTFWERLATQRLLTQLTTVTIHLMKTLTAQCAVTPKLLASLGVTGVLLLDSSSTTLPDDAASTFPAPRKNVAPAAIKWHLLIDVLKGAMEWFELTPAVQHDRKSVPPFDQLKGKLLLFDLGYWDTALLAAIADIGYFLCRVKATATIRVLQVIEGFPKHAFREQPFLDQRGPTKRRSNIVEVLGELYCHGKPVVQARVIGFWNPVDHLYHWYLTNLQVPVRLIYPLYRLRWQIELVFKAAKSSLRLADMPSANDRIIRSLMLVAIIGHLIAHPLSRYLAQELIADKQLAVSYQRAAMILVHLSETFRDYLLRPTRRVFQVLCEKLALLVPELYDPNYRHRDTSLQRVYKLVESEA